MSTDVQNTKKKMLLQQQKFRRINDNRFDKIFKNRLKKTGNTWLNIRQKILKA